MHGIHCSQLVSISQCCKESTAFNRYRLQHAAWIPLHPTWIHCPTLHVINCIHSGCISQRCKESSAFDRATRNPVHQSRPIGPWCMESTAFNQDPLGQAAWNPPHSIEIYCSTLHGIHCIHSGCISHCSTESPALNLDAWNPLHSIGINFTMLQRIHCIQSVSIAACCMDSTASNLDTLPHAACNPLHSLCMYFTKLHGI